MSSFWENTLWEAPRWEGQPRCGTAGRVPPESGLAAGLLRPWVNTAYHIWMTTGSDFYERVGYDFARFDDTGYTNMALHGEEL